MSNPSLVQPPVGFDAMRLRDRFGHGFGTMQDWDWTEHTVLCAQRPGIQAKSCLMRQISPEQVGAAQIWEVHLLVGGVSAWLIARGARVPAHKR